MSEPRRGCPSCAYFVRHPQQLGMGQCIHSPPQVIATPAGIAAMFPHVTADTVCAQWQARPQAPGEEAGQEVRQVNGRVFTGN